MLSGLWPLGQLGTLVFASFVALPLTAAPDPLLGQPVYDWTGRSLPRRPRPTVRWALPEIGGVASPRSPPAPKPPGR